VVVVEAATVAALVLVARIMLQLATAEMAGQHAHWKPLLCEFQRLRLVSPPAQPLAMMICALKAVTAFPACPPLLAKQEAKNTLTEAAPEQVPSRRM
jgi:hypothetical protein